jgi:CheY-like chemotaxis protein
MMTTVLIVDDETNIRVFIKANLIARGFKVVEAGSAEEGLEHLNNLKPSLIILDVLLPGMTGWEMAKTMSEDNVLQDIPVIMLTASISDADARPNCPNIKERLIKPIGSDTLINTVKEVLR